MSSAGHLQQLLLSAQLQHFYRQAICLGSVLSLSVYTWVRLLFHDFPFEIMEETMIILQTLFAGWVLAACCIGSLRLVLFAADNRAKLLHKCAEYCIICYSCCKRWIVVKNEHSKGPAGHVHIELPEMTMRF